MHFTLALPKLNSSFAWISVSGKVELFKGFYYVLPVSRIYARVYHIQVLAVLDYTDVGVGGEGSYMRRQFFKACGGYRQFVFLRTGPGLCSLLCSQSPCR